MDFVQQVRSLKIQSANTIAVRSLKHLKGFKGRKFDKEVRRLLKARPTAVVLYNAIQRAKKIGIDETLKELKESKTGAIKQSKNIFRKRSVVLTHCHSSLVVGSIIHNKKKVKKVIVTETRPKFQGLKTAKELLAAKIPVTYIVDSAVSNFMKESDIVLLGADALRKEGLVNKVGSNPIALVAKEKRKPVYVIATSFTIDRRKKLIMEERPDSEVVNLKGADIRNPAFDVTPWKYIKAVITEKGVKKK